jgi:hypothetical protein
MGSPSIFKKRFLIAIGFAVIFIKSCETKSHEIATPQKLLTGAPWKRIATTVCHDGQKSEYHSSGLYVFKVNETLVMNAKPGGTTKWNISADGKILVIIDPENLGGAAMPYQVELLNTNTLKLKRVLDQWIVTETFSR